MSTTPCEEPDNPGDDEPGPTDCIVAFETNDGAIVIYNRENNTAWIQGDNAITIEDQR